MRVRAKMSPDGEGHAVGYYDLRAIKGGEEFDLSDPKHFSERWMIRLSDKESKISAEEEADRQADAKRKR